MKINSKDGFTIVELLIAMTVGTIIMAAIYAMVNISQSMSGNVGRRVVTQQDARAVLDLMAMEIRMASFNPSMNAGVWTGTAMQTCSGCGVTTACSISGVPAFTGLRRGIQTATENAILVAMNLNGDGIIGGEGFENEYIRYWFDEDTGSIRRAVSCGGNEIIIGGNTSTSVVVNNEEPSFADPTPLFQYFTSAGVELVPPLTDAQIGQIRRIRINIVVDVGSVDNLGAFKVKRRTYSTDVLVRNHGISM